MTRSDMELAKTLAQRLNFLTADQVDRCGLSSAAYRLTKAGILSVKELVFPRLQPDLEPLFVHRPGSRFTIADSRFILDLAKARQQVTTPTRAVTYKATRRAFAIWGDAARKHGNPYSHGHDHILSEVFLRLDPGERAHWRPDLVRVGAPTFGVKVPDAAIVDDTGDIVRFHEAVSANYPIARLMELVEHTNDMLWERRNARSSGIYFW